MSAATKKPPSGSVGRLSDTNTTPSSPRRSATPTSGTTSSTPTRTRSVRNSTPVSARAAAQRHASSLSNATDADEIARAETVALIEDLKDRLQKADATSVQYRKQVDVLQSRLDEALMEQAKLEERVHESEEQIEALRNEKREAAKKTREMENIYEAERSSMMKEKEEMSNREEEMQAVINRLKETLNQRNAEDENRPTRQTSPIVDSGNFAPPSSIQRSDSRNNSKLILQKDKLIESLRLELAEAQIKLVESENQGGGRLHEVERLLMEARMANARLMEDNESYQLLLQEKTLHGDFGKGDFSYMGVSANQDALNALEGRSNAGGDGPTSLADELGDITDDSALSHDNDSDYQRRLEGELRAMKDQNKALTLYINKIIERLLQHQEFEHILDQSSEFKPGANVNKELPPPPKDGPSFLQRAKSIATGNNNAAAGRPKARPMSFMPSTNSAHSNPETAPSIPIGLARSGSTRRPGGRPMSEQFIGAAGVVNQMYKGPDGPISPTLSNPRSSGHFFGTPRVSSTSNGAPSAGNFPGMRSETSSLSGDSAADGTTSASQSPPRTISSQEKGHKFEGNKPRPLRLVQENPDVNQNKRASWIGWAQQAWAGKSEGGDFIRE